MRKRFLAAAAAALLAALLAGCGEKIEDTRDYIDTIGVVIKNDLDSVFDEMYIYPAENDYDSVKREMGPDLIDNSGGVRKRGSYGATVPESVMYKIMIQDNRGGVYEFSEAAFSDGDYATVSYDDELTLIIEHRGGDSETLTGQYLAPDDAPEQPYVPLQQKESFDFEIVNNSSSNFLLVSMREADNQTGGDVELTSELLIPEETVKISGRLFEEDKEKDWVVYLETDDGRYDVSDNVFSPFEVETVTVETDGNGFKFAFEPVPEE